MTPTFHMRIMDLLPSSQVLIVTTTSVLVAVLLPIGFWLLLRRRCHQNRHHGVKRNNKYPPVLPLGWITTTWMVSSNEAPWFLLEWARNIGFVFRIRLPVPNHVYVIGEATLARDILNDATTTKPYSVYGPVDIAVGAPNILTANGERWKHARKATAPAFSTAHIKRMKQVCKDKLEDWIQRFLNVACEKDEAFDPAKEMLLLTLSIISEAAFEYEMSHEEAVVFLQEARLASKEYVLKQGNNPIRATWLGYLFAFTEIRRAEKASRNVQAMAGKILNAYRSRAAVSSSVAEGTVIERIVNNDNYKNDKERIADMIVFLVASHDTTGYSIAWTLLELARHPRDAEKAKIELKGLATDEERLKSPLLDHLIKEAMRLHPVAALGAVRETHRDFRVNADDSTIIPKGSLVFTPVFLLHRNAEYFENPDEYIPERWNTTEDNKDGGAFMPFVSGAHNCLGQALAMAELHTVIARLLIDYEFEVVDAGKPDFELTLIPSGVRLKAKKR